ncbi:glutaredoxin domain-containing protein [Limnoraphis robusta]|uniref:glutaredoxin domain-containing protein n=1 Tax=Limnoraphis robusta TaxID=1118279 RepID=UPI00247939C7|nr:glutaredoxin domain-containing protein [Limnoraphis robusta]
MKAKSMLKERGWEFEEILLGEDISTRSIKAATGATSTPQVFIDGKLIGGSDALEEYLKSN